MDIKIKIIFIAFIIVSQLGCDVMDKTKLKIYNFSQDTVFCIVTTDPFFSDVKRSPLEQSQTVIGSDTAFILNNNLLFPGDSSLFASYDWRYLINTSNSKKITIYFFKYKTLKSKSWEEIREKSIYDKKIILNIEALDACNWIVNYK
ncbi:MAG: hypothetical protein WCO63_15185 [Bacteroidota bacterium]